MFEAASKKYGLDEAILGAAPPGSADDPEATAGRIADLLKHGAVRLDGGGGEEAAAAAGDAFAGEGIDSILAGRTEKRQLGSRAGNSFSVATFAAEAAGGSPPGAANKKGKRRGAADTDDDRAFWAALLPDAVAAREAALLAGAAALGPRRRGVAAKKIYNEAALTRAAERGGPDDETGENGEKRWYKYELEALWPALLAYGEGRAADVARAAGLADRPVDQVATVCAAIAAIVRRAATEAAVTAARERGEAGARVPPAPALPAWLKRAFKDYDVSGRAAKDAARNAERSADHRARVASNGKPLVPSLVDRLDTRAVLDATMAGAADGDQTALRALAAASAAVAHRTTAPGWWEPRHDRALLAAVAARGHNPAPKAAADECEAILKDADLSPMPLAPDASRWVADGMVAARRRHADAVARAEAAAAALGTVAPPGDGDAPPAQAPPPPPPAWDEAAEEAKQWNTLGAAIAKRLGRLLEALLRPPPPRPPQTKAAAPTAPLHRPVAGQATVPSMFRPREGGDNDAGPRLPPRPALPKGKGGTHVPAAVAAALAAGAGGGAATAPLAPRTATTPARPPSGDAHRAGGVGGQEEVDPNRPPSAAAKARAASASVKRPSSAGGGAPTRPMKQTRLDFGQRAK